MYPLCIIYRARMVRGQDSRRPNIHPLYIIKYIFFYLIPCTQLPIILTQSLSFFHASAYYSTSFSYISLFLFLFHHFLHDTLVLVHIHPYHPSSSCILLDFLLRILDLMIFLSSILLQFPWLARSCQGFSDILERFLLQYSKLP